MSKWVVCDVDASTGKPYLWKCDECGEEVETRWNYCPECGDPKTSKGKSINTLVKTLEAEHKKLREMQKAQPKIVHCKDCKNWIPYDWMFSETWQSQNRDDYPQDEIGCSYGDMVMRADDYCSRAERRTDERSD